MSRPLVYRLSDGKVLLWVFPPAILVAIGVLIAVAGRLPPSGTPSTASRTVAQVDVEVVLTRALRGCLEPQFKEGTVTVVCGDENERAIVVHYPDGRTEVTHVVPRSSRLPLATPTLPRGY